VLILSDNYLSLPATTSPRAAPSAELLTVLRTASRKEGATNICEIKSCCNVKAELKETGREDVYWIHLVPYRDNWGAFVIVVMKLLVPHHKRECSMDSVLKIYCRSQNARFRHVLL
jgi:hypothetical protein